MLATNRHCPLCRSDVDPLTLRAPTAAALAAAQAARNGGGADGSGSEGQEEADPFEGGAAACDSKLRALLRELRRMRAADPSSKALVFSQVRRARRMGGRAEHAAKGWGCYALTCLLWAHPLPCVLARPSHTCRNPAPRRRQYASTIDWLTKRLPQEGLSYRTITGSMGMKQRAKAIDVSGTPPPLRVHAHSAGARQ